ncbi:MAG: peroxiredoxin [Granulosicoccus sp.]|nr:peroxiredoxin [Granulosicoccus sp.]
MLKVGDRIPDISLKQMTNEGPTDVSLTEYCSGRKVVIFALPGAFTPTCSETHVPSYTINAEALRNKGVAAVACISTADFFVMDAWGKSLGTGDQVDMLADGNQEFTTAAGMGIDLSGFGLGQRSNRYAMILDDGVISHIAIEPDAGSATVSTADEVLKSL